MAITLGGLIQDPDSLTYELGTYTSVSQKELVVDNTNKILKLSRVGNLTSDGVTLKCLYSKLKELWKSDATLIKYPFAMTPITDEQFEFINGWSLDTTVNPTTKFVVTGTNAGTSGQKTITTTSNFNTVTNGISPATTASTGIQVGMFVTGTGVGTNARVVSIDSNTQITVDVANSGTVSGNLTFFGGVDYTYNLIRTGGWRLTSSAGATQEEWFGAITLGNLGAEQTTKTITLSAGSTASTTITCSGNTTAVIAGSYVTGVNIPLGTTVVTGGTTSFVISKAVTIGSGAIVTVRPKDQIYYQLGADYTVTPVNAALTGQVNQAIKVYGDATHGNFDFRGGSNIFKFYVREQGYTYGSQTKGDIGVTTFAYQAYRFPVSNASDSLKITHIDSSIDTSAAANGIPNQTPYSNMTITWYAAAQSRTIGGTSRNFHVIIDADTTKTTYQSGSATAEQIYEFVQWSLRRPTGIDIDQGTGSKTGSTTRTLLQFVGDTLYTLYDATDGGVYIDSFASADTNRLVFADDTGANRTFPYTAAGSLSFNAYLSNDAANAIYRLFYKQINQTNTSKAFGTSNAVIVNKADNTTAISGDLTGATANQTTTVPYDYDYDGNTQCTWQASCTYEIGDEYRYNNGSTTTWYRVTAGYTSGLTFGLTEIVGTNVTIITGPSVILVAIGLTNSQYVQQEGKIEKSISNSLGAVSALERNFANPA